MQIKKIHVTGVVQGVGFRPFVFQVATRLQLRGWVANTSSGVDIELEGEPAGLEAFLRALTQDHPPLARIDSVDVQDAPSNGQSQYDRFEIRASLPQPGAFQPVSPDISICPDCLRELFDPRDRRYRYPFINCTNCGPRFTIIRDIPYDRPLTTMRAFDMCDDCAREYHDPLDRRFHAQPVACPRCGPQVWLEEKAADRAVERDRVRPGPVGDDAIAETRRLLMAGFIVAIKGLGGFHLACDATDDRAVERLRDRKGRVDKPFALMAFDVASVESFCYVSDSERALLESRERPIVLLRRLPDSPISDRVAPNNQFLGVMLPYTPLHYLLLAPDQILPSSHTPILPHADALPLPYSPTPTPSSPPPLVMTSGNLSEEPIAIDNADARERLATLADYFLMHDRDIETRADDSVVRIVSATSVPGDGGEDNTGIMYIRRSRGYAPYPVHLPFDTRPTLAVGAELKNTFCLTRDRYAFLSQHIGDLENYPALESFQTQIEHLKRLFRIQPEIIACDLHPGYQSTQYAQAASRDLLPAIPVQHHHAHIASCMAENGLPDEPVIGIAFDGTGYGTDGKIWGGEFLLARYGGFTRAAHLAYVPLPGGDAGIRRVYRGALAHLAHAGIDWSPHLPCVAIASEQELSAIRAQLRTGLNAPETSSLGRLFDAVAALIGVREIINYEAQAAIELEHWAVEDLEATYDWAFPITDYAIRTTDYDSSIIIDPAPIIRSVVQDYTKQVPPWVIATRFHNSVAGMAARVAIALRERTGVNRVVLSGGVFQNVTLLSRALALLRDAQFEIHIHRLVPPNDGGISLGQAAVANASVGGAK